MTAFMLLTLCVAFVCVKAQVEWYDHDFTNLGHGDLDNRVMIYTHTLHEHDLGIRITCPKPHDVLPKNDGGDDAIDDPYVYVPASGVLRKVRISNVIQHLMGQKAIAFHQDPRDNTTTLQYPVAGLLVRRDVETMFILCASKYLWLDKKLSVEIWRAYLDTRRDNHSQPKANLMRMSEEMNIIVGIIAIDLSGLRMITHGCGSMPNNPFMNEVQYNEITGERSCTVDVLQHPNIGFHCDGLIEPMSCYYELLDLRSDDVVTPNATVSIEHYSTENTFWVFGKYRRHLIRKEIDGECRCIDAKTKAVRARINVKTGGPSYVCDIRGQLMKNLVQPIIGDWCDIALFPGSTLTIKLPIDIHAPNKGIITTSGSFKRSSDSIPPLIAFDMYSSFAPRDKMEYERRVTPEKCIWETLRNTFPGGAIQVDKSRQQHGEINIHYLKNRPLDHRFTDQGRFTYDWCMNTGDALLLDSVHTTINITPMQTHEHFVHGCEPPTSSIFHVVLQGPYKMLNKMRIGKYDMNSCEYFVHRHQKLGLFCPHDQTLEPDNCESVGYDSSLRGVKRWPAFIRVIRNSGLENHRTFKLNDVSIKRSYGMSCSCVDADGIETARIRIQETEPLYPSYTPVGGKDYTTMVVPVARMINVRIGGAMKPELKELPLLVSNKPNINTVPAGREVTFLCASGLPSKNQVPYIMGSSTKPFMLPAGVVLEGHPWSTYSSTSWTINAFVPQIEKWFPLNAENYFYTSVVTGSGRKLVPTRYSDVLGTNVHGLRTTLVHSSSSGLRHLELKVINPLGTIIVSKTNRQNVRLIYMCGRISREASAYEMDDESNYGGGPSKSKYAARSDFNSDESQLDEIRADVITDDSGLLHDQGTSNSKTTNTQGVASHYTRNRNRAVHVWGRVDISIPTTDPYLLGCGVVHETEELFRPDTKPLMDHLGNTIGCEVDFAIHKQASFYCPLPYHTEPHDCTPDPSIHAIRVAVPGKALNQHLYVFTSTQSAQPQQSSLPGSDAATFECHCLTKMGINVSTIRINNSKITNNI